MKISSSILRRMATTIMYAGIVFLSFIAYPAMAGSTSTVTLNNNLNKAIGTLPPNAFWSITVTTNASDPNEDGEGEGVDVWTDPSIDFAPIFSVTDDWNSSVTKAGSIGNYNISSSAPTVYAGLEGDGDESAIVSLTVNPTGAKKTPQEVDSWQRQANYYGHVEDIFELWARDCGEVVPCRAAAETGAAYEEYLELKYDQMAEDPPDSDYTVIAQPVTPAIPPLGSSSGLTKEQLKAFNGLYHNLKVQMGLLSAIMTSVNRASGAAIAGNTYWQHKQQAVAANYALQLSDVLERETDLRDNLVNVLVNSGFKSYTLTASKILSYQEELNYSYGLGSDTVAILKELGLTSKQIARIKQFIVAQNPNEVMEDAGVYGIPGFMTSPVGESVRENTIDAFRQFAKDNGHPPPDCARAAPSIEIIWPPNNKFVSVKIDGITDPAGSPLTLNITKIDQDEPISHGHSFDAKGLGFETALVRATRSGKGSGRIYFITVKATDPYGESCSATVDVQVPHDMHHPISDTGARYSSTGN